MGSDRGNPQFNSPSSPEDESLNEIPNNQWSRRVRWFSARLGVLLATLVIAGVVIEVGLRLFFPQNLSPQAYEEAFGLPHALKANVSGFDSTSEFHVRFETNSKRLRDREFDYQKPPGVFRILGLGDSFTMGPGVEAEETYLKILERRLNDGDNGRFEVINSGVAGWSQAQESVFLEVEGYKYDPDLVIVGLFANDFIGNITSGIFSVDEGKLIREDPPPPLTSRIRNVARGIPFYDSLAQHSHLVNFVRSRIFKSITRAQNIVGQGAADTTISAAELTREKEIFLKALLQRITESANGSSNILVVYFPSRDEASGNEGPHERVVQTVEELGLPFIDLFLPIKNAGGISLYFPIDRHWNVSGHAIAADIIYEYLDPRLPSAQP